MYAFFSSLSLPHDSKECKKFVKSSSPAQMKDQNMDIQFVRRKTSFQIEKKKKTRNISALSLEARVYETYTSEVEEWHTWIDMVIQLQIICSTFKTFSARIDKACG